MSNDPDKCEDNCLTIPIDSVHCRTDHVRKSFCSPAPLKMTVSDAGLLQPILVSRADDGSYAVIDGARRLEALRELGVQDLIVGRDIIVDVDETEADVRFKQIIVNVQREDLNAIELGQAFVVLKEEYGYLYNEIAEIIGKTPHYVAGKVGLIKRLDSGVLQCYQEEIDGVNKEKCIQNKFPGDVTQHILNVNVLEDIARIPHEMQMAAYQEIKASEMDKSSAIEYIRGLKQRPLTEAGRKESPATAGGCSDRMIHKRIERISHDVEKLADSIDNDNSVGPALAAEIEALIKRLTRLCVKLNIQKNTVLEKSSWEKKGFPLEPHYINQ